MNYKLLIQYDGTNYAGWQIQNNAETIQQKIVDAIELLQKERVNLIGSGRTDAGVHAWGQVANFRTENEIEISNFQHALNSILPDEIFIKSIESVSEDFHSRFDANLRSYIYLISKTKSPFYKNYSNYYPRFDELDFQKLKSLSESLLGKHDFTSFARKNSDIENKICEIAGIRWRNTDSLVYFYISANRFLHGMVRTIVGTLLQVVKNGQSQKDLEQILNAKSREAAGMAVQAKGLFLYKVKY